MALWLVMVFCVCDSSSPQGTEAVYAAAEHMGSSNHMGNALAYFPYTVRLQAPGLRWLAQNGRQRGWERRLVNKSRREGEQGRGGDHPQPRIPYVQT